MTFRPLTYRHRSRSAARPRLTRVLSLTMMLSLVPSLMLSLSACNKSNDPSSPKGAARAFAAALESGDVEAVKKASTGADPQFMESLASLTGNMKKYRDAMGSKFGDAGKTAAQGTLASETGIAAKVEDGELKETGDTATLAVKGDPKPLTLKKVDGAWKVDLGDPSSLGGSVGRGLVDPMAKAAGETADEVNAGKYNSAQEAVSAFSRKLVGAMNGEAPAAPG